MLNKAVTKIEKPDIEDLIVNQVAEGKCIEYKEALPGNADDDRKEFLADVSSFANSAGGIIIYGVAEIRDQDGKPTGRPKEIVGLRLTNVDAEVRRLESMIRDGISPRISGVQHKAIEGFLGGPVMLVSVAKSWASPHMVTYKGLSRFYSRSSSGKYPLDVSEIRAAFGLSESISERIKNFRNDRLAKVIANELPIALKEGSALVLHLLPLQAFGSPSNADIFGFARENLAKLVPLYGESFYSSRSNIDGFLTFSKLDENEFCFAYLQVYRNGIIETADGRLLDGKNIPSQAYESETIKCLKRLLEFERNAGVPPPYIVSLAVHGVKGKSMAVNPMRFMFPEYQPIDRNTLILPDVFIEDADIRPEIALHPVFDAFWQAAGWPRSMNYDKDGHWVGQG